MNDYTEFSTINETGDSINEKVKTTFKLNLSSFKLYLKEKKWIFEIYHDEYGIRGIRQKYINGSNTNVDECGDTSGRTDIPPITLSGGEYVTTVSYSGRGL